MNPRIHVWPDYYATLIHEIAHWTGPRLNREFGKYGDDAYSKEELVAELTAAFVMAELNICGECQHENYIASWLKAMKGDVKYIYNMSVSGIIVGAVICVVFVVVVDR